MRRLAPRDGEWLDRGHGGTFAFEGHAIRFIAGDTYASALAATGFATTARSFKYHRRRGLHSGRNHDANVLLQIDGRPNQRADALLAVDGAIVSAVNTVGGVARDRAARIEAFGRFLPVGFYYKTFIGRRLFPYFEAMIRKASGLGRIETGRALARRPQRFRHCDVAVVGAGLSGLSAALAAARSGAERVVLIDDGLRPGGTAAWGAAIDPTRAVLARSLLAQVAAEPRIAVLAGRSAVGLYEDRRLAVLDATRVDGALLLLRAGAVVLATGTIEQPLVFRNNDLPRVLLSGAAQCLLHRHAVACGQRVVVLAGTLDAIEAALDLAQAGVAVAAVAVLEGAAGITAAAREELDRRGIARHEHCAPVEAVAGGDGTVAAIVLRTAYGERRIACDCLLVSGGHLPALHLALQAGGTIAWSPRLQQHLPDSLPAGVFAAGRANGAFDTGDRTRDGERAGRAAAGAAGAAGVDSDADAADAWRATEARSPAWPIWPHPRGKEFVDLDEDLTLADLRGAVAEGFDSSELLKRYSTLGMGPSQGKLSHLNGLRYLAKLRGETMEAVALTTARPPWQGVPLGALAGTLPAPLRRSALDAVHASRGAEWLPAGNWRRPAFYRVAGRTRDESIAAEVRAVRTGIGVIDVSTLGKFEVRGPDAGQLLDLLYVGVHSTQRVGRTRYAVLADEAGILVDDGVVARFGTNDWYVTATTSAAAATYRELQRAILDHRLDCVLHNLTGHVAAVNLAGPRSRELLARVCAEPIDEATFPHLGCARLTICGIEARVLRVGFVGELGYEIHVPHHDATDLWRGLQGCDRTQPPVPFGVEAQRVLRLEKAHVIVGQDSDALTSPDEAGLGWAVRMDKPSFVAQRSLAALRRRGARQQLIGFDAPGTTLPFAECHLVVSRGEPVGRVTSVAVSPTLGRVIGLALVAPTAAGASLAVRDDAGREHAVRRVEGAFYDPDGRRQRGAAAEAA